MACSSLVETSINKGIQELEREITCVVCHDYFQEPKILPCGHYYCKKCIQSLAKASVGNQAFLCPECRSDVILPNNDSDHLPTAFFINRMKELYSKMAKASGNVETPCEMCSDGQVIAFCRQCTYFICSACVKSHQKMKVFANHIVATLDELKQSPTNFLSKQPLLSAVCPDHDMKLKIFCFDCGRLICRDCIIVDHTTHSYDYVKKVSCKVKQTIFEQLYSLNDIHKQICDAVENVKITIQDVITQKKDTSSAVVERFHELHEALDAHKKLMLDEVSKIVEHKLENLATQEKQLSTTSATVQNVVDSVTHNVENSTDEELLSIHKQILESIAEAISRHGNSDSLQLQPVEEADVRAVMNIKSERFQRSLLSSAQVKHTSADPTKCVVEMKEATEQGVTMTLTPYLPNSKPTTKSQSVEAYVVSKADGLVVYLPPEQMPNRSYRISFIPKVRGRHEITITVNTEKVVHSPIQVFVAVPPTDLGKPIRIIKGIRKPWGIAINSKEELVITEHNGNVISIDKYGTKLHEIHRADHSFEFLSGVAVDDRDNIYVADYSRNSLFKFNREGKLLKQSGQKGGGPCEFNKPRGLTVAKGCVYVCDFDNNRVQVLTLELEFIKEISPFNQVRDISVDERGHLYICDTGNNRIQVFNDQEEFSFSFSSKGNRDLIGPCGVCVANDFVYIVENPLCKDENVSIFTKQGYFVTSFGQSGNQVGQFKNPYGIAIDKDGFLYVCDYGNSRIQIF